MRFVWRALRGFFALIGFVVVLLALVGAGALMRGHDRALPGNAVLAYTFYGTPQDAPPTAGWLSYLVPVEPSMEEVTSALYRAAGDRRVSALTVRLAGGIYDWAGVQELRAAVAAFRAAGKKTYVYAESYGDLYPGMAEYYLASAFDEIWVQPVGGVAITGFAAEVPYFKKTLEKLGVVPEIFQKGDYKTAPESALLESMSQPQRETLHGILTGMMTDFFEGVSTGRKLPSARVGQLIDGAPYTALEAKERNLVDEVGYMDQLLDRVIPDAKQRDKAFVHLADYLFETDRALLKKAIKKEKEATKKKDKKDGVALVYVTGLIVPDSGYGGGMPFGERMAYASDIAAAISDAAEDEGIGAIVLRVDSGGGSPAASETIRRAVEMARQRGTYVVVSMGSQAASGGYWVAVDANRIFAQQGTLTGSIGVFGGKANLKGMWDKLGVNWSQVQLGGNAGMWSPNAPFDEAQRAAVSRMLDDVYDAFIERVAKGRSFAPEVVEAMAGGRVWTGRQAQQRGLVDAIGGLHEALADVAAHLGVADTGALNIRIMPDSQGPFEGLLGLMAGGSSALAPFKAVYNQWLVSAYPQLGVARADFGPQSFVFRP